MPTPLTTADYQMLYDMQMSADAAVRQEASALAKKLTPEEQQVWFDFQQAKPHGPRQDTNILGVNHDTIANKAGGFWSAAIPSFVGSVAETLSAPESVATMGMSAPVRAATGAMTKAVTGTAKVGAGLTVDVADAVAPGIVRRLVDNVRQRLGKPPVPKPSRPPRAGSFEEFMSASPERRAEIKSARDDYFGRRATATPSAPPETPAAAPPASGVPESGPPTSASPPASIRLTKEERHAMETLRAEGFADEDIVQAIVRERQAASSAPPTSHPPTDSATLAATAKHQEYDRLIAQGKSPEEAQQMVDALEKMRQDYKLPTKQEAMRETTSRNRKSTKREPKQPY